MFIMIGSMIMPAISPGFSTSTPLDGVEVAERHDDGERGQRLAGRAVPTGTEFGRSAGPGRVGRRVDRDLHASWWPW